MHKHQNSWKHVEVLGDSCSWNRNFETVVSKILLNNHNNKNYNDNDKLTWSTVSERAQWTQSLKKEEEEEDNDDKRVRNRHNKLTAPSSWEASRRSSSDSLYFIGPEG
jgi:hypothetical protein